MILHIMDDPARIPFLFLMRLSHWPVSHRQEIGRTVLQESMTAMASDFSLFSWSVMNLVRWAHSLRVLFAPLP